MLDENGADKLLGYGDMLLLSPGTSTLLRGQGTFMSDDEIDRIVDYCGSNAEQNFVRELVQLKVDEPEAGEALPLKKRDDLYEEAIGIVVREGRGSVSLLQRNLQIGYGRAARLIDFMAEDGIVGAYNGSQAREVLMTLADWEASQAASPTSTIQPVETAIKLLPSSSRGALLDDEEVLEEAPWDENVLDEEDESAELEEEDLEEYDELADDEEAELHDDEEPYEEDEEAELEEDEEEYEDDEEAELDEEDEQDETAELDDEEAELEEEDAEFEEDDEEYEDEEDAERSEDGEADYEGEEYEPSDYDEVELVSGASSDQESDGELFEDAMEYEDVDYDEVDADQRDTSAAGDSSPSSPARRRKGPRRQKPPAGKVVVHRAHTE